MCLVRNCVPAESLVRENSNPNERLALMNLYYLPRENVGGSIPPLRTILNLLSYPANKQVARFAP
jgi:hypothetical protein